MPLIQGFVLDRLLTAPGATPARSKAGLALMGLSALCVLAGLVYAVAALGYYLAERYPPDQAALMTSFFVLGLGAIFAGIAAIVMQPRKSRFRDMKDDLVEKATHAFEAVMEDLDDPIRNNPKTALAIAALAGFIIADRTL